MRLAGLAVTVLDPVSSVRVHRLHLGDRLLGRRLDRLGHLLLGLVLLLQVALAEALTLEGREAALPLLGSHGRALGGLGLALNGHLGLAGTLLLGHLDGRLSLHKVLGLELLKGNVVVSADAHKEHAVALAGQGVAGKGKGGGSHCFLVGW